jgi:HEAT repeat protein
MLSKRQKIAWLAGILLTTLGILAVATWFTKEPSDQGRPLSRWLQDLDNPSATTNAQTIAAFRRMGAKAAIRLVPMLEASDSALKLRAVELARKQSFFEVKFTPASVRRQRADKAFEIMGTNGLAAAPRLVSLLVRSGTNPPEHLEDSANRAAAALTRMGHGAIPYLRPALHSEHVRVRRTGLDVLVSVVSWTPETLAELLKLLNDPGPEVRKAGTYVLGKFPREPNLVIPALERMLVDVSPSVRRQAAFALGRFGPLATNSMSALRKACSDTVPDVRQAAETALIEIRGEITSSKDADTSR